MEILPFPLEMLLMLSGIPCWDSGKRWQFLICYLEVDRNLYGGTLSI